MSRTSQCALALLLAVTPVATFATEARRLLTADDVNAVYEISDPQLSPDGEWVAYTVTHADLAKDEKVSHIWMASWDGKRTVQLTYSKHSESHPRWSPDGKFLAFLTSRGEDEEPAQVWLLDRLGGEAKPLSGFNGEVVDFEWSPDASRLALIVRDEDPERKRKAEEKKTPAPIVIDRYYFKEDETGYLGARRQHLYVLDVASRQAQLLTPGPYDESLPSWSPDGSRIAFYSKRGPDPDRHSEFGLYVIEPQAGATASLLTRFQGEIGDGWMARPAWSPDGRQIAVIAGGDPKLIYYALHRLAVVPATGGEPRIVTANFDRNVLEPKWSADGRSIYVLLEDDRNQHLARVNAASGAITRVMDGRRETTAFDLGKGGRIVVLDSTVHSPEAVYALDSRGPRLLTHHNDEWLASVKLGEVEEISYESSDGTLIGGFVVKPPDYVPGRRYPTILWIHGGPVSQYANAFSLTWQIFASDGYVVVGVNPRGSSGRGEAFSSAIYADWGNKDTQDVLAGVDHVIELGLADPDRLGVGGWSYGGILTNFVISKDTRFKSATSGSGISNVLAGYGTDMYVREYEVELGRPWENLETWLRVSYPFFHADRIKTPTLFQCGDKDFNVPLLNSEQMYQALKSLGVETQLVIYPGQYHGFNKPSHLRERMQRYLDWHGRYLKPTRGE
ncbi:MAG TPA: S9 family peptidase [Steroidobacter sp.]